MWIVKEYTNQKVDSPKMLITTKAGKKEFNFLWNEIKRKKSRLVGLSGNLYYVTSKDLREIIRFKYKSDIKIKLNGNYPLSPLKLFSNPLRFKQDLFNYVKDVYIPMSNIQLDNLSETQLKLLAKASMYQKKVNQKFINAFLYYSPVILNFNDITSQVQ